MEPFQLTKCSEIPLLELAPWTEKYNDLSAGMTTKIGGVSSNTFSFLNCGLHVDDELQNVVRNREIAASAAGFPLDGWTYAEQVHGSEVARIDRNRKGRGNRSLTEVIETADAMISNEPGIFLALVYADCVPLYFFDPAHRAAGIAHAGWKGTAAGIAAKTVKAMAQQFGTRPEHLQAAIGPSIGACCYEVDRRVLEGMNNALPGMDLEEKHIAEKKSAKKWMLNLKEMNRQIMIKAGILSSHIELSNRCTSCNADLFFSHRRDQGKTGRMQAWIGILENTEKSGAL